MSQDGLQVARQSGGVKDTVTQNKRAQRGTERLNTSGQTHGDKCVFFKYNIIHNGAG